MQTLAKIGLSLCIFPAALEIFRSRDTTHPVLSIAKAVDEPRLVIIESWDGVPLKGGCSACPSVIFDVGVLIGSKQEQDSTLTALFTAHYDDLHVSPDERYVLLPRDSDF